MERRVTNRIERAWRPLLSRLANSLIYAWQPAPVVVR
jgi:hypothetical protein